jgi:hypothetical protein
MTKLASDASPILGGGRPIQSLYNGTVQNVGVAVAHAESNAFGDATTVIRIVSTSACYYLIGKAPVATTSNGSYLPAGIIEFPQVCRGDKISVIRASADGNLNITEGA